jgi:glycine reductase
VAELRIVHYLNQLFGGIGGEDRADEAPRFIEQTVGPGRALQDLLGDRGRVVGSVICGDNHINEHTEADLEEILSHIKEHQPDLVIAGPAFMAGRYGVGCGLVASAVQERLGLPAVTGMHPDNPGAELFRTRVHILITGSSPAGMIEAHRNMLSLGIKLANGTKLGSPQAEGYLPQGVRLTEPAPKIAAERAVDMLLAALRGQKVETEWPLPEHDTVPPAAPIADVRRGTVALVTSGGLVPRGNPQRIEATRASKWASYSLEGVEQLDSAGWQCVHGGYDTTQVNRDPHRVVPLDALRALEREGLLGRLYDRLFVTVGSGSTMGAAQAFAREMLAEFDKRPVDGVIFVST